MLLSIDTLNERYVNPYTDFGFKLLFGTEVNKDLLVSFLNALLNKDRCEAERMEITDLEYLPQERLGRSRFDRRAIFDIYCQTADGKRIIVEMQNAYQDRFRERSIYYSSFPIQEQNRQGPWDFQLDEIYTIGILNFVFDKDEDDVPVAEKADGCYHEVKLMDTRTKRVFYDKLTYIYLEMPKFNKQLGELRTLLDKWLFVLKNMTRLFDRPAELQERVFKKIFRVAEVAAFSDAQRFHYDDSIKAYRDNYNVIVSAENKGKEQGRAEGKAQKAEEIALRLLAMGMTAEQVSAATGMSVDDVNGLK